MWQAEDDLSDHSNIVDLLIRFVQTGGRTMLRMMNQPEMEHEHPHAAHVQHDH